MSTISLAFYSYSLIKIQSKSTGGNLAPNRLTAHNTLTVYTSLSKSYSQNIITAILAHIPIIYPVSYDKYTPNRNTIYVYMHAVRLSEVISKKTSSIHLNLLCTLWCYSTQGVVGPSAFLVMRVTEMRIDQWMAFDLLTSWDTESWSSGKRYGLVLLIFNDAVFSIRRYRISGKMGISISNTF